LFDTVLASTRIDLDSRLLEHTVTMKSRAREQMNSNSLMMKMMMKLAVVVVAVVDDVRLLV